MVAKLHKYTHIKLLHGFDNMCIHVITDAQLFAITKSTK